MKTLGGRPVALACPDCHGPVTASETDTFACGRCNRAFAVVGGVPSLMPEGSGNDSVTTFFRTVAGHMKDGKLSYVPFDAPQLDRQLRILSHGFEVAFKRWARPNDFVLDVGCGHGALLENLLPAHEIVGVDVVLNLLQVAHNSGYVTYHADATHLPFEDDQFDVVVCAEVLQHFPSPGQILGELARVCKDGGKVLISTLNKPSLVRLAARTLNRALRPSGLPLPVVRRTADEIACAASTAGLAVHEAAWILSPARTVAFAGARSIIAPFATNFILCLVKN